MGLADALEPEWCRDACLGAQQGGGALGPALAATLLSVCMFTDVGVCLLMVTAHHVSKPPVNVSLGPSLKCSKGNVDLE